MTHFTPRTVQWKSSKRKRKREGQLARSQERVYERLRSGHLGFSLIATLKTHHGLASTPLMLNSVSILHHNFALYQNIVAPSVGKTFANDSHRKEKKLHKHTQELQRADKTLPVCFRKQYFASLTTWIKSGKKAWDGLKFLSLKSSLLHIHCGRCRLSHLLS